MSYSLLEFEDFNQLLGYIDARIQDLEKIQAMLSNRYEELSVKAERIKRLEEALSQLVGKEVKSIREIDFMGLRVVVGARVVDELNVIDEVLASVNDTLAALRKVREVIEQLSKTVASEEGGIGFRLLVETVNGIPVRILLKEA